MCGLKSRSGFPTLPLAPVLLLAPPLSPLITDRRRHKAPKCSSISRVMLATRWEKDRGGGYRKSACRILCWCRSVQRATLLRSRGSSPSASDGAERGSGGWNRQAFLAVCAKIHRVECVCLCDVGVSCSCRLISSDPCCAEKGLVVGGVGPTWKAPSFRCPLDGEGNNQRRLMLSSLVGRRLGVRTDMGCVQSA
ncbi:hypothetical protein B0J18DRAFT_131259 [Chaetomium sp. MPI-SDFR-AT-0129]|nr:hypothetical protein B0J18DRAFT_131259 [Chaetomium sp. MPI-SDFR-AT-0129]